MLDESIGYNDLNCILSRRQEVMIPDNAEECNLLDVDPEADSRRRGGGSRGNAYDEDEPVGSRVQCAPH